jgi:hypothetical protein
MTTNPAKPEKRICGIPSRTLGACDLPRGHDGDMHVSAGDGFYAADYAAVHRLAQSDAKPIVAAPGLVRTTRPTPRGSGRKRGGRGRT